MIIDHSRLNYI